MGSASALPSPVASASSPAPTSVAINSIAYGGTGCPQGSLSYFLSTDHTTFTLIFDDYVASIGPGTSVTDQRKNCQLDLDLVYPSGFQYSIFNTEYRGYVQLDAGVTARQQSTFYFSGQTAQTTTGTNFVGPKSTDYEIVDTLPLTSVVWSPCGALVPLNINSELRLNTTSKTAGGYITDDSLDGKITFVVGVQWQTC